MATDLQTSLADNAGIADPAEEAPAAAARPNPAGAATAVTSEPFPYGTSDDAPSFFRDLYVAQRDHAKQTGRDAAARVERAHAMWHDVGKARAEAGFVPGNGRLRQALAAGEPIPQANVFVPNQYDIGLYVDQLHFPRKLVDNSPKTSITGPNPFLYPKFASSTADGGSGEPVTAHTEGTNPVTGELDIDAITATPFALLGHVRHQP